MGKLHIFISSCVCVCFRFVSLSSVSRSLSSPFCVCVWGKMQSFVFDRSVWKVKWQYSKW